MYSEFLNKAQLLGGKSANDLLVCACQTHPVHKIGGLFKAVDKNGPASYTHILQMCLICLCLKCLAGLVPYCPKPLVRKVSHFIVKKLQKADQFVLSLLSQTQLVTCRPIQYNHVFITRDWETAIQLIKMEKTIKTWCQVKEEAVKPYDHTLWRVDFMCHISQVKKELKQVKKGLVENLFFHPFWSECFVILTTSIFLFYKRDIQSVEVWNQLVIGGVIADLIVRSVCMILRYIRINLALMYIGKWRKCIEEAQERLFENTKTHLALKNKWFVAVKNKFKWQQATWIKKMMWLDGSLRQIRPRYCVFRLYIVLTGFYVLMRIKLLVS